MAPIFEYKAVGADGKPKRGIVEAEAQKAARLKLKKQGLMVTDIQEKFAAKPNAKSSSLFGGGVSLKDVTMTTRQLASLIKANVPLVESLNALIEQSENEKLKVVLSQVRQDVNEGVSLARACAAHPKVFDTVFVNMVEAGESSGTLGLVLLRLAELKDAQMRLRSKLVSGMSYPVLMMTVAMGLMIAIFTLVIPKLAQIFIQMKKPMPPLTRVLINFSDILVQYWYLIILAVFFAFSSFRKYIVTAKGKAWWDAFKLKLPVIGPLIRMIAMTRFANTMGTLLGSGVPILSALNIARNLVDNAPISKAISDARENITEGQSIAEPLKRSGQFPPLVIHMIAVGEKTGELSNMLQNVSETYEEQVNTRIEGLTSLLEPMMIVVMGGIVAVIVMSVFMPLLDMSNINSR